MTNKFYDLLGRQYEWRGEATRMQFVKTWLAGTAMSILYFLPFVFYFWKLFEDSIDYGVEAAMLLMVEEEVGPAYYAAVILWQWTGVWVLTGMFVMILMTTVRRLANMGWSRWWVILTSVPIINILFLLILFFWPGRKRTVEERIDPALPAIQ